jgi:hypothetical protein
MPQVKFATKPGSGAEASLEPYAASLYARNGARFAAVAELHVIERVEPAPDSEGRASVKLAVSALEIANVDQEPAVREALAALYMIRTADGTLTGEHDVELSERTLAQTGGEVTAVEASRLRLVVRHWATYAGKALDDAETVSALREELKTIREGLRAAEYGTVAFDV